VPFSAPVDGFRLAYERAGAGPAAVLLHRWPGWRADYRDVVPLRFEELVALYARPGAFAASIAWYRAGSGAVSQSASERPPAPEDRIRVPTSVLWGEHEPLFPPAWADRIGEFHADVGVEVLAGVGHFAPLEAPAAVAEATVRALRR
jgi:pimeloyl-ACP methyl ester carboxylesterase